ncbi:phospholipase [Rhodopseudomonas sp. BR0M22]|uniref:carboxylesterase family protein n=1 Tax=Rhodopseudomonas sp. BR0M22 TaxID=2269369 RepID=UPI0013E0AF2D|nr:phospholipase [Rhodopseudomonas sp. BR0M22]NEW91904.1 phospholipase [Rhodopseudomonas sp. BR0M22]
MSEAVVDDIVALLPPLLQTLESLGFVARYLHPPEFSDLLKLAGTPEDALRAELPRLANWPETFTHLSIPLQSAGEQALAAFAGLRAVDAGQGDLGDVFRALRHLPQALEALYPLAATLPPVSSFFLEPASQQDEALLARLTQSKHPDSGVFHRLNEVGSRGGYSLYVPEYYDPAREWPLVMALHGGSGHGRMFLWSWLRDARSRGAIVVAPTARGRTWALRGDDVDSPNLARILDEVRGHWRIDSSRLLLTGLSDGGTFCYVSGLTSDSPFTHLAPIAASFHPLLAGLADSARLSGLPIQIVHGRHDWMFPVEVARQAHEALVAAGADVSYREIADLSHSYPREANTALLDWLKVPAA